MSAAAFWKKLDPVTRGSILVFSGAISISFGPIIIKTSQAGATSAAFYRMLFGGLALLAVSVVKRESLRPARPVLLATAIAGAAFCGDLFFWHRSIILAGPGLSTILANFQVFVLAIAGVLFFGEKPTLRLFGSILLAFVGLIMLLEADIRHLPPDLARGVAYGLITSLFLSCYMLALRHSRRVATPLRLAPNMAWVSFFCALFLGVLLLLEGESFALPSVKDAGLLAVYGVGCQAVGWLVVSAGLPLLSPGRGGLLLMAEPLFAFIWDVLFMDRPTGLIGYSGAIMTILAICICLNSKK